MEAIFSFPHYFHELYSFPLSSMLFLLFSQLFVCSFARHKVIKWWCQSFLVCIPVVVCGFRNDNGIVTRLTDYPTSKLPSIGQNFWLPNVCMNFLDAFLTFAKSTVNEEDVLFRFWWDPNSSEVHVVKPKHQDINLVLPEWYKNELFKQ